MNPLELKKKKERLQRELDGLDNLLTAPLRYLEYAYKNGTALGHTYKLKSVKAKAA